MAPDYDGKGRKAKTVKSENDLRSYLNWAFKVRPERSAIDHLIGVNICPAPLITEKSTELMRMYRFSKQGLFPVHGGYYDQPLEFIEAAEVIRLEETILVNEDLKNGRRKKR